MFERMMLPTNFAGFLAVSALTLLKERRYNNNILPASLAQCSKTVVTW
jgi:hypothetical protein